MILPRFERIGDYGLVRGLHAYVMDLLKRILGLHLYAVELGDDRPDIDHPELPPGYTTRRILDLGELMPWAGTGEHGLTREFLEAAIARGDRATANFYQGELVGYGFVARQRAPVTAQIEVLVEPRLIYRYKGWTHPEHRRRHLSYARGRINRSLFGLRPGQRTVGYIETHNYRSRLHRPELHPIPVGHCGFFRIAGREYPFTMPGPKRFGFRLARRAADPASRGG